MMNSNSLDRRRRGASTLEAVMAFTLLSSVLAVATPLVVRHSRLLTAQQDYRLAMEELSNQHDRLANVPDAKLAEALEELAPSKLAAAQLPGVELRGEVSAVEGGQRVRLQIWWDEPNRSAAPLSLSAWRFSAPEATSAQEESPR